jgi:hypothetical protein
MPKRSSSTRRPAPRPRTAQRRPTPKPAEKSNLSSRAKTIARLASDRRSRGTLGFQAPAFTEPASHRELTTKRRGELAELAFALKASNLGFGVSKPYGDSERYDFILDPREIGKPRVGTPLWRIQVKCTTQLVNGLYRLNAARRLEGRVVPYRPGEIDFLAAYIFPEDTWYIVPLAAFLGRTSLFFRPRTHLSADDHSRLGQYDPYREAWPLLRPRG